MADIERDPTSDHTATDAPRLQPGETQRGTFGGEEGEWFGTDDPARPVFMPDSGGAVIVEASG